MPKRYYRIGRVNGALRTTQVESVQAMVEVRQRSKGSDKAHSSSDSPGGVRIPNSQLEPYDETGALHRCDSPGPIDEGMGQAVSDRMEIDAVPRSKSTSSIKKPLPQIPHDGYEDNIIPDTTSAQDLACCGDAQCRAALEGMQGEYHNHLQIEIARVKREAEDQAQAAERLHEGEAQSMKSKHESDIALVLDQHHARQAEQEAIIEELRKKNASLKSDMSILRAEMNEGELEMDRMVTKLQGLQASAFKSIEPASFMPLSKPEIGRRLGAVAAELKQWSEKYQHIGLLPMDPQGAPALKIRDILAAKQCMLSDEESLNTYSRVVADAQVQRKLPALLLSAVACNEVFLSIFAWPWFVFAGHLKQKSEVFSREEGQVLGSLVDFIYESDKAGAHAWRSQLMRLLHASSDADAVQTKVHAVVHRSKEFASRRLAANIVTECEDSLLLTPGESKPARESLYGIIRRAADLSWSLWMFKTEIRVWTVKELLQMEPRSNGPVLLHFSSSSLAEPSKLHASRLEDDDTALDGVPVLFATSPAVVAFGDAEGNGYESWKVWRKAVVWLGRAS